MVSFTRRQCLKATRILVMVAAGAAPYNAFSQPELERASSAAQKQIVERIQEVQSVDGLNSTRLIDPLKTLGLLFQEGGDHALAIAAIERARQVVSVNFGLYSLEEAFLLRQMIRSEEARGNFEAAWDLEQELLSLVRQHRNDIRIVPILHEIADKRIDVLRQYRAGGFPPQIVLGCYYGGSCRSGSRRMVIGGLAQDASAYYVRAIELLLANDRYSNGQLRELVTKVLRNDYLHSPYGVYSDGGYVLRLVAAYEAQNPVPTLSRVDTLVQVADWNTLFADRSRFDEQDRGLEQYERAYEQLAKEGMERESIEERLSPRMPVVLPAFLRNPLASGETSQSIGHIDVAFDITKYGESEHIEVLETTTNATRPAERDLVRLIKRSRFRPRLVNGRVADSSRMVVRYYLND